MTDWVMSSSSVMLYELMVQGQMMTSCCDHLWCHQRLHAEHHLATSHHFRYDSEKVINHRPHVHRRHHAGGEFSTRLAFVCCVIFTAISVSLILVLYHQHTRLMSDIPDVFTS